MTRNIIIPKADGIVTKGLRPAPLSTRKATGDTPNQILSQSRLFNELILIKLFKDLHRRKHSIRNSIDAEIIE
jgi:hypothetical protein